MDELALYQTNRPVWLAIAAPKVAARISEAQRERIRKVRETK